MFTILGADQKQYGPVSADDIRQWILEGRADGRTIALQQGATEWKPLSAFPEFAEALANAPRPAKGVPPRTLTLEEIVSRDYEIDIFNCISRGWNLVSKNMGLAIGATWLVLLTLFLLDTLIGSIFLHWVKTPEFHPGETMNEMLQAYTDYFHQMLHPTTSQIIVSVLQSILISPFQAILTAGLYRFYLKLIRGERAGLADAFSGFGPNIVNLIIAGLIVNLAWRLGLILFLIPGIYLYISLIFSFPLVLDKRLSWSEAMTLSLRMVNKHWLVVLGLFLVASLVGGVGLLVCCVGVLFTMPVTFASMAYGYEEIFGNQSR